MPTVTALRAAPRGRVAVELDGEQWRVLPAEAVLRTRLVVGGELDRPTARRLRRELRRLEALAVAGRTLRRRDLSAGRLEERLRRASVAPAARRQALSTLERVGALDDARFGRLRAEALAARGYGNAAIAADLERQGVSADVVREALAALEPEPERALRLVRARGPGPRTARYLAGKGFGPDALEAALEASFASDP